MEFPQDKFKAKKDRYAKFRGGASKFLYISCYRCEQPVMVYQKDGKGRLLRCYADRIVWPSSLVEEQADFTVDRVKEIGSLVCSNCNNVIANPMIYEIENRPAYRVVPGSIHAYRSPEQAEARASSTNL